MPWREGHDSLLPAIDDVAVPTKEQIRLFEWSEALVGEKEFVVALVETGNDENLVARRSSLAKFVRLERRTALLQKSA